MGKGSPWTYEEVKALISVWAEANIQQQLDGAVRNKSVFEEISKRLRQAGIEKDWQQCRAKVKNLKSLYKKVKDSNGRSGRGRNSCHFFDDLDAILGSRPATQPPIVVESLNDNTDSSSNDGDSVKGEENSVTDTAEKDEAATPTDTTRDDVESSLNDVEREIDEENVEPPTKKRRMMKKKMTTAEKMMTNIMQAFIESQKESEERYFKYEEKRAKEERAHEERILQLLLRAPSTSQAPPYFPPHPSTFYPQANYQPHMQQFDSEDFND